jgi:hypothetical protein
VGGRRVLDPDRSLGQAAGQVQADPAIALVADVYDLATGVVRQVIARGTAEVLPFDVPRGRRMLTRYLGADQSKWDDRFAATCTTIPPGPERGGSGFAPLR